MEEVTEENISNLIRKVPKRATKLEIAILFNEGTVQTLLSTIFRKPVKVEVINQLEFDDHIVRYTKLTADGRLVCFATSTIMTDTSYAGFIQGIREKKMGIGQLISSLHLSTERKLMDVYSDDNLFFRSYVITSDTHTQADSHPLYIIITEVFPKKEYHES